MNAPINRRIVIAGGTGFVGKALAREFNKAGYQVVVLSRSGESQEGVETAAWDGETVGDWAGVLNQASGVINLAGAPVTLRWTDENRRKILESRTKSTEAIGKAIRSCSIPPPVWVNASALGLFGDRGDEELDEASSAGTGFLAETCLAWEQSQKKAETPQTRKAQVRVGIVLGNGGGAFDELAKITQRFLGGAQGSGQQWMSWIHIEDLAAIFRWAVESDLVGPVHGVGLHPVRNAEMMSALREAFGRPWSPSAPAFALKAVGALIDVQTDVLLQSQRAKSKILTERQFEYKYPELRGALKALVEERNNQ